MPFLLPPRGSGLRAVLPAGQALLPTRTLPCPNPRHLRLNTFGALGSQVTPATAVNSSAFFWDSRYNSAMPLEVRAANGSSLRFKQISAGGAAAGGAAPTPPRLLMHARARQSQAALRALGCGPSDAGCQTWGPARCSVHLLLSLLCRLCRSAAPPRRVCLHVRRDGRGARSLLG